MAMRLSESCACSRSLEASWVLMFGFCFLVPRDEKNPRTVCRCGGRGGEVYALPRRPAPGLNKANNVDDYEGRKPAGAHVERDVQQRSRRRDGQRTPIHCGTTLPSAEPRVKSHATR